VKAPVSRFRAGFTLVELLIGLSLSVMIMGALLSSYVFLARSFTRTLGVSSANQPAMETQGRQTLALFAQDVAMAIGISGTPSASSVTLRLPTAAGTTTVTYSYNSTTQTLTRTPQGGAADIIHINLLDFSFTYYDSYGRPYTTFVNYLSGIDQLSMAFSAQAGSVANGTRPRVYGVASPKLIMRNKPWLP